MPRAEDQRIGVLPMAEKQEQADGKRASFGRNSSNFGWTSRQRQLRSQAHERGSWTKRNPRKPPNGIPYNGGVKTFLSQANKVNHVLGKASHNLKGYTVKTMGRLMKKTLEKGVYAAYKSVDSMIWAAACVILLIDIFN